MQKKLAEMQKDAEGLNNDKGEFKKFKRERGREGRKRVDKSVKIGFYGRYFRQRGRLFTAPSVSPMLFIFIGHLRAVGVHERHGRFRAHVTNVLIFRPVYLSTCYQRADYSWHRSSRPRPKIILNTMRKATQRASKHRSSCSKAGIRT